MRCITPDKLWTNVHYLSLKAFEFQVQTGVKQRGRISVSMVVDMVDLVNKADKMGQVTLTLNGSMVI